MMRLLDGITNGHEFEQTLGDSEGQGSLACCRLWGRTELNTTEVTQQQQQQTDTLPPEPPGK